MGLAGELRRSMKDSGIADSWKEHNMRNVKNYIKK